MSMPIATAIPWAPHPAAAPSTFREANDFIIAANGTRTCVGGWQITFEGVKPGQTYALRALASHSGLTCPRDQLECTAHWAALDPDDATRVGQWDYLLPHTRGADAMAFERTLLAPADASVLTVRYTLRWTPTGAVRWTPPEVIPVETTEMAPRSVRVAVVTGPAKARGISPASGPWTIARNMAFYVEQTRKALGEQPDLILLPEVCLQWQVPGKTLDQALTANSPEVTAFRDLARQSGAHIGLGFFERDGDAVFNTVLLIGPQGQSAGAYHKVHLAVLGESDSGVLPGDSFPVFETPLGRIGGNICMDSSAAESSRIVGLNGADWLLLPIMGDHRADRWSPGPPIFNEGRWLAIQRTHAMDSQLTLVIARNEAQGSAIINRKGDLLAYNEGDQPYIVADVSLEDGYRTWNGGCFRDVNWVQRRPHLYGPLVDQANYGNSR